MYDVYVRVAINLAAAWAAGSLIGAERTYNGRAAGFRTHALVGLAAAAAMTTAMNAPLLNMSGFPPGDATRVTQGVMTGVGFLGAGAILRDGMNIRGLTTAATIWCAAAVGAMAGSGWIVQALIGTVFIVACNVVLKECARLFFKTGGFEPLTDQPITLTFCTDRDDALKLRKPITNFLESHHLLIRAVSIEPVNGHMAWCICVAASSSTTHPNAETLSEEMADQFSIPVGWKLG